VINAHPAQLDVKLATSKDSAYLAKLRTSTTILPAESTALKVSSKIVIQESVKIVMKPVMIV
jgi:hypothetical protein